MSRDAMQSVSRENSRFWFVLDKPRADEKTVRCWREMQPPFAPDATKLQNPEKSGFTRPVGDERQNVWSARQVPSSGGARAAASGRSVAGCIREGPTYLDEVRPLGKVLLSLAGLLENPRGVLLGQLAADGTGLLRPQVQGKVGLVLVEETELRPLLQVDDGQDTGDRLAQVVAIENPRNP